MDNTAVLDYSNIMVPKLILCAFDILFFSKPSCIVFIFIYHWNLSVQVGSKCNKTLVNGILSMKINRTKTKVLDVMVIKFYDLPKL